MAPDALTFVLSLLLSDDRDANEVVLGVRQPRLRSPRHPGVLSTPTQRVPQSFFETCWPEWPAPVADDLVVTPVVGEAVAIGVGPSAGRPLSYLVESLLVHKLGLGLALAEGKARGVAAPVAIGAGVVDDPQGGGQPEPTVMLTIEVQLGGLRTTLPERTCHYAPLLLAWTGLLAEAMHQRDALVVSDLFDPFEVCIGGLCIASAVSVATARTTGGGR